MCFIHRVQIDNSLDSTCPSSILFFVPYFIIVSPVILCFIGIVLSEVLFFKVRINQTGLLSTPLSTHQK